MGQNNSSIIKTVLFITVNLVSFPCIYFFPLSNGLDQSWIFALSYINNSNAKFGKDHFFTYGPLGFLGRCQPVGNNLYLGILFWMLVMAIQIYLYRRLFAYAGALSSRVLASALMVLALPVSEADIYLCFLALVALLAVYKYEDFYCKWIAVFLSGVVFLFKFSGAILLIATLMVLAFCAFVEKKPRKTVAFFLCCIGAGPLSYLVYHPSAHSLYLYVRAAIEISLGYNRAMSLDVYEAYYLWVVIIVLCYVALLIYGLLEHKKGWVYFLILAPACFFWYKEGFVRNDGHHLLAVSGMLLVCSLLVCFLDIREWAGCAKRNLWAKAAVCSFCIMAAIPAMGSGKTLSGSVQAAAANIFSFPKLLHGCATQDFGLLQEHNQEFMGIIGSQAYTTFPWEITENISYGNSNFVLAPLLQNYTVYTPFLDRLNAGFYTGSSAPEYIIFYLNTIDGRLPLVEAPATWEKIYQNYCVAASDEEKFLLKKRERPLEKECFEISRAAYRAGDFIEIPQGCTFVKLEAKPGLKGSLQNLFYKTLPVNMEVAYRDGAVKQGRAVVENLVEGIEVGSLVWGHDDFIKYMGLGARDKEVAGITLAGPGMRQYSGTVEAVFYGGAWKQ